MLDCRHDTLIFILLSWSPPHMLEAIRTKQINLHLIWPKDMVLVIHVLCWHIFSNLFGGFLVYRLQKRLPPGVAAIHTNLMQSVAYGLSTNRLTPHLFNLYSNADRTPTPIFQRKYLDVTLSTCAQLLWTTYSRPVLRGPCTFKTLDDLSHCAATQFQGVGGLFVALAIFM